MGFINSPQNFRGADYYFQWGGSSAAGGDPQLQFFENFPLHIAQTRFAQSQNTISFQAVNIPLSISLSRAVILASDQSIAGTATSTRTIEIMFGLYSLNGNTLSQENSGSQTYTFKAAGASVQWRSLGMSAQQNVSPGAWWFALKVSTAGRSQWSMYGNGAITMANPNPISSLMGRMTVSSAGMPASVALSDLDITGGDATRQPFIIITA